MLGGCRGDEGTGGGKDGAKCPEGVGKHPCPVGLARAEDSDAKFLSIERDQSSYFEGWINVPFEDEGEDKKEDKDKSE